MQARLYAAARSAFRQSADREGRVAYAGFGAVVPGLGGGGPIDPSEDPDLFFYSSTCGHVMKFCQWGLFAADLRRHRWGHDDAAVLRATLPSLTTDAVLIGMFLRDDWEGDSLRGWALSVIYPIMDDLTLALHSNLVSMKLRLVFLGLGLGLGSRLGSGLVTDAILQSWPDIVRAPTTNQLRVHNDPSTLGSNADLILSFVDRPRFPLFRLAQFIAPVPRSSHPADPAHERRVRQALPPNARAAMRHHSDDEWKRAVAVIQVALVDAGCAFPFHERLRIVRGLASYCSRHLQIPTWTDLYRHLRRNPPPPLPSALER